MNRGPMGSSRRCQSEGVATVRGEFNVFFRFNDG